MLVFCFSIYQYQREKDFKLELMQSHLHAYTLDLIHHLDNDITACQHDFHKYIEKHNIRGLRVSIITPEGNVLLDSKRKDVSGMGNHKNRNEIKKALKNGHGYDIKRTSETLNHNYFYYATFFKEENIIIRVAVPYNTPLTKSLEVDSTYFLFAFIITVLLGMVLYRNTKRIARHIRYLRRFALRAERGEPIDKELQMKVPDDELGDISHTIIVLYWKLKKSEEDKLRIKRQLTQNAAHELKTPAASIQGYLETIINNPDMPEDKRTHFIERCYAQSERMSKLLQDMATLTKLDEGTSNSSMLVTDISDIITSVIDDTMLQLQEHGITPVINMPADTSLTCDPSLIYSIFRNLVDNAIAYANGADKITITCSKQEQGYEFVFADNGCGIEPQHLPHIFERFYRVDKGRSRKLGGTGLGLSIVKNAVTTHGGTISAEHTPGGGLTIKFTLKSHNHG